MRLECEMRLHCVMNTLSAGLVCFTTIISHNMMETNPAVRFWILIPSKPQKVSPDIVIIRMIDIVNRSSVSLSVRILAIVRRSHGTLMQNDGSTLKQTNRWWKEIAHVIRQHSFKTQHRTVSRSEGNLDAHMHKLFTPHVK